MLVQFTGTACTKVQFTGTACTKVQFTGTACTKVQFTGTACTKVQMAALGQTVYTFLFLVCFRAVAGRTAVWRRTVGSWGMDWKGYGTKRGAF